MRNKVREKCTATLYTKLCESVGRLKTGSLSNRLAVHIIRHELMNTCRPRPGHVTAVTCFWLRCRNAPPPGCDHNVRAAFSRARGGDGMLRGRAGGVGGSWVGGDRSVKQRITSSLRHTVQIIHGCGRKGMSPREPPSLAEPTRSPADAISCSRPVTPFPVF